MPDKNISITEDPLWYKDAVIYQLHIKAFYDGNNDGIGDFQGLMQKLDYLEDIGITAIWLLPFYPSPLKDDGYDIADYFNVNPDFGTIRDFKEFLREAHRRGIRVITELVLNHTSDQHAWFQRARKAKPGSVWRDFYVWSGTTEKYQDARIIFVDFEPSNWAWDPVAKAYYWHRFYSHQPDLNFDNPQVHKAMLRVIDFWFDMGVDGVRLDAVPYLYEREGTNCENLPETHAFLKKLRAHVDKNYTDKMLLAEANQWPEDAVEYFGDEDECHMAFHFPVMPRIFMGLQMEDRFPIIDILGQTPGLKPSCQWAMFLCNHDELTLEMVTDEERDYMYKVYARDPKSRINLGIRRRLAPLVVNNRRKIELLNVLLFSLPGTPIIYYGDEIGMGDNYYLGDRNGVRTPMQWNSDRNAGFSKANPQKLYLPVIIDPEYQYEAINAENQGMNPTSLLWWMKHAIAMRRKFSAFGRGDIEFISSNNPKVISFVRSYQDEIVLVVINLSRFPQVVELDLSHYDDYQVEEIFGQSRFLPITAKPYVLTLGFHDYFWFALTMKEEPVKTGDIKRLVPQMKTGKKWESVFQDKLKERLQKDVLPSYLLGCRWFGGKGKKIHYVYIVEDITMEYGESAAHFLFLKVGYIDGASERYLLPVSFASGETAEKLIEKTPGIIIACLRAGDVEGVIYDAVYSDEFRIKLLKMIMKRGRLKGSSGQLFSYQGGFINKFINMDLSSATSQVMKAEQSNTSVLYGNDLVLKLFRKLEEGTNPDTEVVRFLSEKAGFKNIPPFAGAIEYRQRGAAASFSIGQLQGFVQNQGDAWQYTLESIGHFFEKVLSAGSEIKDTPPQALPFCDVTLQDVPDLIHELIGGFYLEMISLLGSRTGELHIALSSSSDNKDFSPEPYSMLYQRSVYQSMRNLTIRMIQLLRTNISRLPEDVREEASEIISLEKEILEQFHRVLEQKITTVKMRYHGDYHLGQVLFTGNDFVIIDFEGEPARSLTERRTKRSPVRDLAGMIRSFHYATHSAIVSHASVRPEDLAVLKPWTDAWYCNISGIFLNSYLQTAGDSPFVPRDRDHLKVMLNAFLLEKAVYEVGYELNNRPSWVILPIRGIKQLLKKQE